VGWFYFRHNEESESADGPTCPADGGELRSTGFQSTALREGAGIPIRFPMAVKERLLGIISAEFVAEELPAGVPPNLQLSVNDGQRLGAERTSCRCGGVLAISAH
jgi:hypothetical protein